MNLARSLLYAAERTADAEALVGERERLTYAELRERAARIATGLAGEGARRGDRVACVLRNEEETVQLYWGAQWLGACLVLVDEWVEQKLVTVDSTYGLISFYVPGRVQFASMI